MKQLLDSSQITKAISQMAAQIAADSKGAKNLLLLGVRSRGVPLAQRIAAAIKKSKKVQVPVGVLDITLYRDDLSRLSEHPLIKKTELPCPVEGKVVWLVDDVLYTGRTVRAAMDAVFDFGRPAGLKLAVLVDRGGRELPVQADAVGIDYQGMPGDNVKVRLKEIDGEDRVVVVHHKQ